MALGCLHCRTVLELYLVWCLESGLVLVLLALLGQQAFAGFAVDTLAKLESVMVVQTVEPLARFAEEQPVVASESAVLVPLVWDSDQGLVWVWFFFRGLFQALACTVAMVLVCRLGTHPALALG